MYTEEYCAFRDTLGLARRVGVRAGRDSFTGSRFRERVGGRFELRGTLCQVVPTLLSEEDLWHVLGREPRVLMDRFGLDEGRLRQTTFEYKGRAKYEWRFNDPTIGVFDECRLSPDHGTIDEPVGVSVNVTRTRKRGWSYSGGNGAGGSVGEVLEICPGEPDRPHLGGIERAFEPGGYSRDLRRFAGTETGDSYRFNWSFRGTRKTCRKK